VIFSSHFLSPVERQRQATPSPISSCSGNENSVSRRRISFSARSKKVLALLNYFYLRFDFEYFFLLTKIA
jgi:hypothetical protein